MKNSQFRYFVLAFLAVLFIALLLAHFSLVKAVYWMFGLGFGFVLQRSRFCFAAAFRDPILFGDLGVAKAVVLMLGIATLGFSIIQYQAFLRGLTIPGKIYPVGLNTIVGAFIFGIGMVLAGGCVGSTLSRIGEGFLVYSWSLAGLVIGSLLGIGTFDWWSKILPRWQKVFLPAYLGWGGAVIGQIFLLAAIFSYLSYLERKTSG